MKIQEGAMPGNYAVYERFEGRVIAVSFQSFSELKWYLNTYTYHHLTHENSDNHRAGVCDVSSPGDR